MILFSPLFPPLFFPWQYAKLFVVITEYFWWFHIRKIGDDIMNWANVRHQQRENLVSIGDSDLLEICKIHLRNVTALFFIYFFKLQDPYLFLAGVVKSGPTPLHFLCHPIYW